MEINNELNYVFKVSALPPSVQILRQWQALVNDPRLHSSFPEGETLQEVGRNEQGYFAKSENYFMQIELKYLERTDGLLGPAAFELVFHDPLLRYC